MERVIIRVIRTKGHYFSSRFDVVSLAEGNLYAYSCFDEIDGSIFTALSSRGNTKFLFLFGSSQVLLSCSVFKVKRPYVGYGFLVWQSILGVIVDIR